MPVKRRALSTPVSLPDQASTALEFPVQRLLRIPQAAVYLGCSVWAVRDLLRRKEIIKIKLGKKFLIDRTDLDKYIDGQKPVAA